MGAGWQLVRWLRLASADAQKLLARSGDRGVFMQIQPDKPQSKPPDIHWPRKEKNETCDQYLHRVQQIAVERKCPVRLRHGMGSDLRVDRTPEDTVEPRLTNLDIAGVPPVSGSKRSWKSCSHPRGGPRSASYKGAKSSAGLCGRHGLCLPQGQNPEVVGNTSAKICSTFLSISQLGKVSMLRNLLRSGVPRKKRLGVFRLLVDSRGHGAACDDLFYVQSESRNNQLKRIQDPRRKEKCDEEMLVKGHQECFEKNQKMQDELCRGVAEPKKKMQESRKKRSVDPTTLCKLVTTSSLVAVPPKGVLLLFLVRGAGPWVSYSTPCCFASAAAMVLLWGFLQK